MVEDDPIRLNTAGPTLATTARGARLIERPRFVTVNMFTTVRQHHVGLPRAGGSPARSFPTTVHRVHFHVPPALIEDLRNAGCPTRHCHCHRRVRPDTVPEQRRQWATTGWCLDIALGGMRRPRRNRHRPAIARWVSRRMRPLVRHRRDDSTCPAADPSPDPGPLRQIRESSCSAS